MPVPRCPSQVFGVPFEVIPFKTNKQAAPPPPVKRFHVYALPNRAHLEIKFPRVEGYTDTERYLILETKGCDPLKEVKEAAAKRWKNAVNADVEFGSWALR